AFRIMFGILPSALLLQYREVAAGREYATWLRMDVGAWGRSAVGVASCFPQLGPCRHAVRVMVGPSPRLYLARHSALRSPLCSQRQVGSCHLPLLAGLKAQLRDFCRRKNPQQQREKVVSAEKMRRRSEVDFSAAPCKAHLARPYVLEGK